MPRLTRLLAQALVILGLAPVAYAIGLVAWQIYNWSTTRAWVALSGRLLVDPAALQAPALAAVAPFVPSVDWAWANHPKVLIMLGRVLGVLLDRAPLGLLAVLAGWALISIGRALASRQAEEIAWRERQRADRLRRAAQYRV